jgi:hypothetical protein
VEYCLEVGGIREHVFQVFASAETLGIFWIQADEIRTLDTTIQGSSGEVGKSLYKVLIVVMAESDLKMTVLIKEARQLV